AARAEWHRSGPELGSERQQILLARLAAAARIPRRGENTDRSQPRDVQHAQQQEQRDPAHDTGVVQLRRVPAAGCRRSAPGSARGEDHLLTSEKGPYPFFNIRDLKKGYGPF